MLCPIFILLLGLTFAAICRLDCYHHLLEMMPLGPYKLEGWHFVQGTHWLSIRCPWLQLPQVLWQRLAMPLYLGPHLASLQVTLSGRVLRVGVEGSGGDNMHEGVACGRAEMDGERDEEGGTCTELQPPCQVVVDGVDHVVVVAVGMDNLRLPENEVGRADAPVGGVHTAVEVDGARMWLGYRDHWAIEKVAVAADLEEYPSTASFELVEVLLG
jgi:hypothetical protein